MDKSERAARGGVERRAYPVQLETRAAESGVTTIEGYASVFNSPYEIWDSIGAYNETIKPGSFARTLGRSPQVQLLLNHGGLSMAATDSGTLRLSEDSRGLHMAAELNTKRSDVRDLVIALEDRNISEMSFAFRVLDQNWSQDYEEREIRAVDINRGDVSVVNFGANPTTSVALRAQDFDRLTDEDARVLLERLQGRFKPAADEPMHPRGLVLCLSQVQDQDACKC